MAILLKLNLCLMMFFVVSCSSKKAVKVYASDPLQGGLVRTQGNELIPYDQSRDFVCLQKDDLKKVITAVKYKSHEKSYSPYRD